MPAAPSRHSSATSAAQYVADLFRSVHWAVEVPSGSSNQGDWVLTHGKKRFVAEVKALSESRPDRVLPMLSMAILQAQTAAKEQPRSEPLAVVYVPEGSPSLIKHIDSFADRYAKGVSVGIVSGNGWQYFKGEPFQALNGAHDDFVCPASRQVAPAVNLFSDLNQWMLKLLLARELPEGLLNAPRKKFRTGAELAETAQVSAMSASRFLQQLRSEGYLSESSPHLDLVRREELLRRWSAATMRSSVDVPCRFLLRAPVPLQIGDLLSRHADDACLALFAAADELGVGHVSGVPPYVYVDKLPQVGMSDWTGLMAHPNEQPDLILRQAPFPRSTFRGAIRQGGHLVTDIIQTWLDVLHHPARGAEQADLIFKKFLSPLCDS